MGEQSRLISKVQSASLPSNASLEQFELHVTGLLTEWLKIDGNSVGKPAGFYYRLLHSFPSSDTGKLGHLRSWLADRMSDDDAFLRDPHSFVEKFTARAATLGLVQRRAELST